MAGKPVDTADPFSAAFPLLSLSCAGASFPLTVVAAARGFAPLPAGEAALDVDFGA
jgi:hypothetical protein